MSFEAMKLTLFLKKYGLRASESLILLFKYSGYNKGFQGFVKNCANKLLKLFTCLSPEVVSNAHLVVQTCTSVVLFMKYQHFLTLAKSLTIYFVVLFLFLLFFFPFIHITVTGNLISVLIDDLVSKCIRDNDNSCFKCSWLEPTDCSM